METIDIRVLSVVSDTSGDDENSNNKSENEVNSGTWSLGEIERFEDTILEQVEHEGNQKTETGQNEDGNFDSDDIRFKGINFGMDLFDIFGVNW